MVEAATMNPSQVEVPMGQFVKMNILMWNYRDALNPDFKRRVFEMAVNHHPSIMVIIETRVGGTRAKKIIEGLPFDGFIITDTIGYTSGLWICGKVRMQKLISYQQQNRRYMRSLRHVTQTFLGYLPQYMLALV